MIVSRFGKWLYSYVLSSVVYNVVLSVAADGFDGLASDWIWFIIFGILFSPVRFLYHICLAIMDPAFVEVYHIIAMLLFMMTFVLCYIFWIRKNYGVRKLQVRK